MGKPPSTQRVPKQWLLSPNSDQSAIASLAKETLLHPLAVKILYNQGLQHQEDIQSFIQPSLHDLYDPFILHGMHDAVDIILDAVNTGQSIIIHGDYDVDGISSVSLLYGFLLDLGATCNFFIPTRDQDGYGISCASVERFHQQGFSLLISTDCGISNVESIQLARDLGMSVVVVDHHQVPEILPPANAIVNPLLPQCPYPFKHLAAVGVTFLLAVAIRSVLRNKGVFNHLPEPNLKAALDLVALGTVADIMSLHDQNRILVHHGLHVLSSRKRPGISALMERTYIPEGPIRTHDIAFKLAPRLNAAGRMGDASICVQLLTTNSYAHAIELSRQLEELNQKRKDEESRTLDSANPRADEQHKKGHHVIVLADRQWHQGVLGIVAARLVDALHKPVVLLGLNSEGIARGSARGIPGIDLVELFHYAEDCLLSYGGHTQAAGLSLHQDHLETFHQRLEDFMNQIESLDEMSIPILEVSEKIPLSEVTPKLLNDLTKLGPFGSGNPEPSLVSEGVRALSASVVGRNHLKVRLIDNDRILSAFGFSLGHHLERITTQPVTIAYSPRFVKRRGELQIELFLRGIRDTYNT